MKFIKNTRKCFVSVTFMIVLILLYVFIDKLYSKPSDIDSISPDDLIKLKQEEQTNTDVLVKKVFADLNDFKQKDINYLMYLYERLEQVIMLQNSNYIYRKLQESLDLELSFYNKLNPAIDKVFKEGSFYISCPLWTNKMIQIISESKKLIENHFFDVIDKKYLLSINAQVNNQNFLLLDKHNSHWLATSQPTFLKTALLAIIILLDPKFKAELLESPYLQSYVQIFELPKDLFSPVTFEFSHKNLIFSDFAPPDYFKVAIPHNGYALGGNRDCAHIIGGDNNVHDCTSWLEKLLSTDTNFTTLDLVYFHRYKLQYGFIDPNWFSSNACAALDRVLIPIKVDSINDIKVGMVFAGREFELIDSLLMIKDQKRGMQGHAGVILSVNQEEGTFLLASYNRNIPEIEGLSIRKYSFEESFRKKNFYFLPISFK